jgi:cobalt/nickel transport system permease protein
MVFFIRKEIVMHMSDALVSPAVGGVMLAAGAAAIGFSAKKLAGSGFDEKKVPLMGILGAFIFAGQMINFTIPGTGSSGHIGGGILLAAILGPYGALITLASVLIIQCLFFADGGLLAYGANVVNMGVFPCLFAYPLIFKPLAGNSWTKPKVTLASIVAVVAGLQLGALAVVLETLASRITELPFATFLLLMQPIHLAIGIGEGLVTAAVLCFVQAARPELLESAASEQKIDPKLRLAKVLGVFAVLTLVVGGALSIFASAFPDGLEWSLEKAAGTAELEAESAAHSAAGRAVEATAFLPDYGFKNADGDESSNAGTSISGIAGSLITLVIVCGIGFLIHIIRRRRPASA